MRASTSGRSTCSPGRSSRRSKWKMPVAVHHHLLAGLGQPGQAGLDEDGALDKTISSKMSKSKPDSAIFIHDSPEEISRKVGKAWCPERVVEANPVLEFTRYIVFHERSSFTIERPGEVRRERRPTPPTQSWSGTTPRASSTPTT